MDWTIPFQFLSSLITNLTNGQISQSQKVHEEEMVDKQNEYNLPVNQMQRLKDAGINPTTLGMGQGTVVQGNTSASPNPYTPYFMQDPMSVASNSFLSMMSGQKAKEEAKSEDTFREERAKNIELQNKKYLEEINLLGLDARAQQIANDYANSLNEIALMQGALNLNKTEAEIAEINKNIEQMEEYILHKLPAEVQKLISENKLNILEQDKVLAEIQRIYADTENIQEDTELKQAQQVTEQTQAYKNLGEGATMQANLPKVQKEVQFYLDTYEDALNKFSAESKLSVKESRWFVASKIFEGIKAAGGAGAAAGIILKAIPK